MSEDDTKEWAENNFRAMKNKMQSIVDEMRNNKPQENINVRRISSDKLPNHDTDQVIVEYKVEKWYSINYFKKMMQDSDTDPSDAQDENVIF